MEKLVITYSLKTNEFQEILDDVPNEDYEILYNDSGNGFYQEFAGIYPVELPVEEVKNHLLQAIAEYVDSVRVKLLTSENNLIKAFSEIHKLNSWQ